MEDVYGLKMENRGRLRNSQGSIDREFSITDCLGDICLFYFLLGSVATNAIRTVDAVVLSMECRGRGRRLGCGMDTLIYSLPRC